MHKFNVIGIHGAPGSGKDSVAAILVESFGFMRRGFADPLYEQVSAAFNVTVDLLQNRDTKETKLPELALNNCSDTDFAMIFRTQFNTNVQDNEAIAPREILRCWGTEYRRVHSGNDAYWIDNMHDWIEASGHKNIVIPDVRFNNNEAPYVRNKMGGQVWHVDSSKRGIVQVSNHGSELGVDFIEGIDKRIDNSGTKLDLDVMVKRLMLKSAYSPKL